MPDGEARIARSRLRWFDADDEAGAIEVVHVRGVPVIESVADRDAVRRREWPNRLGMVERGTHDDDVRWYPELAERPPSGRVSTYDLDGSPCEAVDGIERDLARRAAWLQTLVHGLTQHRGVSAAAPVSGTAGVLLTPRGVTGIPAHGTGWGAALGPVPRRLAEFPGGLQVAVTDRVWSRRDEYAAAVSAIVTGGP